MSDMHIPRESNDGDRQTREHDWNNAECKEWIEDYLATICDYQIGDAVAKSSKFKGCGMNMYMLKLSAWNDLLGQCEGTGVFGCLMEFNKDGKYCRASWLQRKDGFGSTY